MAGTKKDAEKEYSPNWGGKRKGQGRPKGSPNKGTELGRKKIYKNITVTVTPEEAELIRRLAAESGKTISRFVVDCVNRLYVKTEE